MIQLINCNLRDMSSYYGGTTLVWTDESGVHFPVQVDEVQTRTTLVVRASGNLSKAVERSELRVHYYEPFYTDSGEYIGFNVDRSYKRAPSIPYEYFKYLHTILNSGSLTSCIAKDGSGRLGQDFFLRSNKYNTVEYRCELVGIRDGSVIYVRDSAIAERLRELIAKESLGYDVVQVTN